MLTLIKNSVLCFRRFHLHLLERSKLQWTKPFEFWFCVFFALLSIFSPPPGVAQQWELIQPTFHPPTTEDIKLTQGKFFTPTTGIAIDANSPVTEGGEEYRYFRVWKTIDGGQNWNLLFDNDSISMVPNDVAFHDSLQGWVIGNSYPQQSPLIYRTQDGGATWENIPFPDTLFPILPGGLDTIGLDTSLFDITFRDSLTGFVTSYGSIFHTTDGGATWDSSSVHREVDQIPIIKDIAFSDSLHGWGVGSRGGVTDAGMIVRTSDGGIHWDVESPLTAIFEAIDFMNEYVGAAFGYTGVIWQGIVFVTRNGGTQWEEYPLPTQPLNDGVLIDSMRGWAIGHDGAIFHTADAGFTWSQVPSPTSAALYDIEFVDHEQVGFILGSNNTLLKYDSTETTIEPQNSPLPERVRLVQPYPNPFNASTVIQYQIPNTRFVTIEIVNLPGKFIRTLVQSTQSKGRYHIEWDGRNAQGEPVSSGIYFVTLSARDFHKTRKMVYLK